VEPGLVVRTDRVKLARVLANLITNGIKFTDQGHVVLRCAVRPDGQVALDVSDTGIGIAAEFQEKVFDEYFQLRRPSRERERGGGSGLGLAICRRLVATMGGRLEVHSQPGNGSTFSVLLPASTIVCTAAADSVAAAKAPSVAAS
jgi:two-component system capsular synthesis sensor histidine kinase RcsC